jgi:hypothetical protein
MTSSETRMASHTLNAAACDRTYGVSVTHVPSPIHIRQARYLDRGMAGSSSPGANEIDIEKTGE